MIVCNLTPSRVGTICSIFSKPAGGSCGCGVCANAVTEKRKKTNRTLLIMKILQRLKSPTAEDRGGLSQRSRRKLSTPGPLRKSPRASAVKLVRYLDAYSSLFNLPRSPKRAAWLHACMFAILQHLCAVDKNVSYAHR